MAKLWLYHESSVDGPFKKHAVEISEEELRKLRESFYEFPIFDFKGKPTISGIRTMINIQEPTDD